MREWTEMGRIEGRKEEPGIRHTDPDVPVDITHPNIRWSPAQSTDKHPAESFP